MLTALIENKVYFKIFDKTFKNSSHVYHVKDSATETEKQKKTAEIDSNILAVKSALQCNELLIISQVHGSIVIDADQINEFNKIKYTGDASITMKRAVALAVKTADCVPVLLSCQEGSAIGVAHCGWKGVQCGVISNLVDTLKNKGVNNIKAIIGPAIQQFSYEVDQQFYESFTNLRKDYKKFFIVGKDFNHYMFDLPGLVKQTLKELDIFDIITIDEDTYTLPEKYPSHRRCTHQNIVNTQHILSTILIR